MNTRFALVAAFVVPLLCAQDDKSKTEMQNPKTKNHEALAQLAGDWSTTCKMAANPKAGMNEPTEWTGTERAELICNGLWLKATTEGKCKDKSWSGVWVLGFDPLKSKYTGLFVTNEDEPSCAMEGTCDEAKKTWTFTGKSPNGPFRSVYVWKDADTSTETCFVTGEDGKEVQCMEITRKRSKGAVAKDATVKATDIAGKQPAIATSKESSAIAEGIGKWDCVVSIKAPNMPAGEEKATENVVAICDGKWTWSDFRGTMMGQPFEGHAIVGYETQSKQIVSYWIDSMAPQITRTSGTFDAAQKVGTFTGECCDEKGKPMKITQTLTIKDKNTRQFDMTCAAPDGAHEMKIAYKRAGN